MKHGLFRYCEFKADKNYLPGENIENACKFDYFIVDNVIVTDNDISYLSVLVYLDGMLMDFKKSDNDECDCYMGDNRYNGDIKFTMEINKGSSIRFVQPVIR